MLLFTDLACANTVVMKNLVLVDLFIVKTLNVISVVGLHHNKHGMAHFIRL